MINLIAGILLLVASGEGLKNPDYLKEYNPSLIEHQIKAQIPPPSALVQGYCYDIIKHMRTFGSADEARANFEQFAAGVEKDDEAQEVLRWYVPMVREMINLADQGKVQEAYDHCLETASPEIDPEA